MTSEILLRLKGLLINGPVDHKLEILKESSMKFAHIYCKINKLSGQKTGPLIEYYIRQKHKMTKNKASECKGDLNISGVDYEIKVSNGGEDNSKFNFVQIRMNHVCDYLLSAYYLCSENVNEYGELFIFKIDKPGIINLVLEHGGYAHGTKSKQKEITPIDLTNKENIKEYSLRPKYGDTLWKELLVYRVSESDI